MQLGKNLTSIKQNLKAELRFYRHVQQDPRTPRAAKILLGLALAYALSPIDFIPDFIPEIGYLDDVLIVGLLVMLAMRLVPREVWPEKSATARLELNRLGLTEPTLHDLST